MIQSKIHSALSGFSANKKYVFYSLLKYIEYAINAFIFIFIARLVTPAEYGGASNAFLTITYSGFLLFGINQVIVKWYSRSIDPNLNNFLIRYTFAYTVSLCLLIFVLIFFSSSYRIQLFVASIACFKIIIECFVTVFRVRGKVLLINTIYLSAALSFLLLFLFYVKDIHDFFASWALSSFFGMIYAAGLYLLNEKSSHLKMKYFVTFFKRNIFLLIRDGWKFTVIAVLSTLFITVDRIFAIYVYEMPKELLGNIQISDNISNMLSLGLTSVLFVVTPNFIAKVYNKTLASSTFYKQGLRLLVLLLFVIIVFYYPGVLVVKMILPKYAYLDYLLAIYILMKAINVFLFVPNILAVAASRESTYIRLQTIWLAVLIMALFALKLLNIDPLSLMFVVPLMLLLITVLLQFHLYLKFNRPDK